MIDPRRLRRALVLSVLVGLPAACVPMTQGVPRWAMHVQPAPPDPAAKAPEVAARLTAELANRTLRPGHLSPEQIALVAVDELERGRLLDAGLWLSIASYRYHQEAIDAAVRGNAGLETLPYGVPPREYMKLVLAEVRRFAGLEFHDEVRAIAGRLEGRDEKQLALQQQFASMGKTDPMDQESLHDLWSELRPKTEDAAATSHYPTLAEAFRVRLRNDAAKEPEDRNPAVSLSEAPIPALKKDAIYTTSLYFEPVMCWQVAAAFPALRPAMIVALTANRPQARANAAATLGMAPSEETKGVLQDRLAVETDPRVKLVLSYSLARHGVAEQALPLVTALQSCKQNDCLLPTLLLLWLPSSVQVDPDQASLAKLVGAKKASERTRLTAAALLRRIGRDKPLQPVAIEALIAAARFKIEDEEDLQIVASEAVQESSSLSRADVLARLDPRGQSARSDDLLHPCALLARLARVALIDDLPLLKRMMERFGAGSGPEPFFVVEAALSLHGAAVDSALMIWFDRYKNLQTQIGVGLAARDSVPRATLDRLLGHGGARAQIAVKAVLHTQDVAVTVTRFLQSPEIEDRYQAAELAALTGAPALKDWLRLQVDYFDAQYYPNDALLRHAAMASIVRLALFATNRASAPAPVAEPASQAPPTDSGGAPPPAAASP
jgi:hypothetical protein